MSKTIYIYFFFFSKIKMFGAFFSAFLFLRPETENYVLGHFRPNIFGGRIFGAFLITHGPTLMRLSSDRINKSRWGGSSSGGRVG
jgi:heme/copper-type cytochrome/quinol oxidase subunit 3